MLKTTRSSIASVSRANDNEVVSDGGAESGCYVGGSDVSRKKLTKSKSWTKSRQLGNNHAMGEPKFLTPKVRKVFNYLRQAFTKVPIFRYFDLKYHIRIETNISDYFIGAVLS